MEAQRTDMHQLAGKGAWSGQACSQRPQCGTLLGPQRLRNVVQGKHDRMRGRARRRSEEKSYSGRQDRCVEWCRACCVRPTQSPVQGSSAHACPRTVYACIIERRDRCINTLLDENLQDLTRLRTERLGPLRAITCASKPSIRDLHQLTLLCTPSMVDPLK